MLKINNACKYFNYKQKNQINAINNTSIIFDETGLIALLGPSGCGKTTLLNVIGGLDKIKSGSIIIDEENISKLSSSKLDENRNLKIGYIFQDYKLINDKTVFENVSIVLEMIGIKNKEEIKKRTEYVLDSVGMLRYKKRPVTMLSGGEKQRVAIARALVKNPEIILADEPTGNLDSKNSLEIMKIIKSISKTRLVVLVTHEQSLAKFYSTRIIEINDGNVVKDYKNDGNKKLDYIVDTKFYLKDFEYKNSIVKDENKIEIYGDKNVKINLNLVYKNGNLYIKNNNFEKIEIIDENSNIELLDEEYQSIDEQDVYSDFSLCKFNDNFEKKYSSIFSFKSLMQKSFYKILDYPIFKKLLLLGFFFSAIFIMFSASSIGASLFIDEKNYVTYNKNYVILNKPNLSYELFNEINNLESSDYILPGNSIVKFNIELDRFYQVNDNNIIFTSSVASLKDVGENDLLYGKLPKKKNEIVIDVSSVNKNLIAMVDFKMVGLGDAEKFIGYSLQLNNVDYKIVGITNTNSPSVFIEESELLKIVYNNHIENKEATSDYTINGLSFLQNDIVLVEGVMPKNKNEVLVSSNFKKFNNIGGVIKYSNDINLKVVGFYDSKETIDYLVSDETIINVMLNRENEYAIYTDNSKDLISDLDEKGLKATDSLILSKNKYMENNRETLSAILFTASMFLGISLIEIFLMIRSSFLSRVKEIGILRAIGVKKTDIYKMFLGEVATITTISSVPGIMITAYILSILSKVEILSSVMCVNFITVSSAVVLVYLFNSIVGLIPVYFVIRKTPSEILSRIDVD